MKERPQYDHEIIELLQKRWSPRAYSAKALTEEQVLTLFEAARWAASCSNLQPWRFIWSLNNGSERYNQLFDCLDSGNQVWAKTAPLLILALIDTKFPSGKPNRWAAHDLGLAIGNLTAQASSMDLYVHNMAGFSAQKAVELFAPPAGIEPLTMITIGYLGDPSVLGEFNQKREAEIQSRKALGELFLD